MTIRGPLDRRAEDGLTIIEVMVASALLLAVATAVFTAVYGGLRLQATARQRAAATAWADHLMELARNQNYDAIGLSSTGAAVDAAVAAVPAGDTDNPNLLVRRNGSGNCLEFNTGTPASPSWERLIVADWYTPPDASPTCATQTVNNDFHLVHAGGANDHVAVGTPAVTYSGWVFVTWAAVEGLSNAYYKRVTVIVRFPSPSGGISRTVQVVMGPAASFTYALFGRPPGYGSPSAAAVTTANAALATLNASGGLDRTYVIWQDLAAFQAAGTTPPALKLDVGTLRIARDTVIYTNVPVDFGNTTRVEAAQACSTQDPPPTGTPTCPTFQVISAYPGSPCTGGVGNCPSILGGNKIQFRPELAVLLYTREGTIELRNDCNADACNDTNHGAFYANTIDAKNNLNLNYTPRIANALGFGRTQLQQVSWQELAPCPAGQTPPC